MPTSHYSQIPDVIAAAIEVDPKSILEIGIGCGKYGALLREYVTVWDHYWEPWGARTVVIDGIEVHAQYADSPAWACYDNITIADVWDVIPGLCHYDMALMVDVLEHFEQEDGLRLIAALLDHADTLLLALPAHFFPTIEVWNNPHEIHKAAYPPELLREHGYDVDVKRHDDALVMLVRRIA